MLAIIADKSLGKNLEHKLIPRAPISDSEFLSKFQLNSLDSFGHDAKIRAIYLLLLCHPRSSDTINLILEKIQSIERGNAHASINFFWIHMVDYYMKLAAKHAAESSVPKGLFSFLSISAPVNQDWKDSIGTTTCLFSDFYRIPCCQPLRNAFLYENYYSNSLIDNPSTAADFVIPDLKQLPSVL